MLERSGELRLGERGDAQWRNDERTLSAMLGDVLLDRRWRCLLLGEERSAQLEVEELGSGSGRDVGGENGWVGGFKVIGGVREGRADVFKEGRKAGGVGLLSQFSTLKRRRFF